MRHSKNFRQRCRLELRHGGPCGCLALPSPGVAAAFWVSVAMLLGSAVVGQPANDNFIDRQPLSGLPASVQANNFNATGEADEPQHGGEPGGRSLWWAWTSPITGQVGLAIETSDFIPVFGVYRGTSLTNLVPVMQGRWNWGIQQTFAVEEGATYLIAIDSSVFTSHGAYAWSLYAAPPPANDDFARSTTIGALPATILATNLNATREPLEPIHGTGGDHSVWWNWTAPEDGQIGLPEIRGGFRFGLYSGEGLSTLEAVPLRGANGPTLFFAVQRGRKYHLVIDGLAPGYGGAFSFTLFDAPPPANDTFTNGTALFGLPVLVSATSGFAFGEPGEPVHGQNGGQHSVWWSWTATQTGDVGVVMPNSGFTLRVYVGTSVSTLQSITNLSQPGVAKFRARLGTTYHIAVDYGSWIGEDRPFTFAIERMAANDSFANREVITNFPISVMGNNHYATPDPGGPMSVPDTIPFSYSVWWEWVPLATDRVGLRIDSDDLQYVTVYSGNISPTWWKSPVGVPEN